MALAGTRRVSTWTFGWMHRPQDSHGVKLPTERLSGVAGTLLPHCSPRGSLRTDGWSPQ